MWAPLHAKGELLPVNLESTASPLKEGGLNREGPPGYRRSRVQCLDAQHPSPQQTDLSGSQERLAGLLPESQQSGQKVACL